jgi:hypothetical protein
MDTVINDLSDLKNYIKVDKEKKTINLNFDKVIFNVGLLSGDIKTTLPAYTLICSIATKGSSTP